MNGYIVNHVHWEIVSLRLCSLATGWGVCTYAARAQQCPARSPSCLCAWIPPPLFVLVLLHWVGLPGAAGLEGAVEHLPSLSTSEYDVSVD